MAHGGDPSAERARREREAMTIAELAGLYLAEGPAEKPHKKASSWGTNRSTSSATSSRFSGKKLAERAEQSEVAKFQADIAAGKSKADVKTKERGRAIVEGGRGTAARSLAVLGAMLEFAGRAQADPGKPGQGGEVVQLREEGTVLVGDRARCA